MAKKVSQPRSVYQELLKHAQLLVRTHEPKALPRAEAVGRAKSVATEYAALAAQLVLAEAAAKVDLLELARRVGDTAAARARELQVALAALQADRGNVERRRRQLADLAANDAWAMLHREKQDFIGPLTLDHTPERTRLLLGKVKLVDLGCPSAQEVLDAVGEQRRQLEAAARAVWSCLKEKLVALQGLQGVVTWPQVKGAFEPPKGAFKRVEQGVLFALVLLRQGSLEPGWALHTQPPALAQQSRAVVLPRIDRPGSPEKVFALRIEGQAAPG